MGFQVGEFFVLWCFLVVVGFSFYSWGKCMEMIPFLLKFPILIKNYFNPS